MQKILCSTGAIVTRNNGRDHRLIAKYAPELVFDGFEFMMCSNWYDMAETVVKDVLKTGISVPVYHCRKEIGELITAQDKSGFEIFEKDCGIACGLGAGLLVLHLWNGIPSDSAFENNLRAYERLYETAEKYGLLLTVENVVCNNLSPEARLYELKARYPDISFTFDTKMADFHGELLSAFDSRIRGSIKHMHINDYGGGYMDWQSLRVLHLGDGHIDFDDFFRRVSDIGYNGDYTVEATSVSDDGSVDIDKLNRDFLKIKGYIAKS